MGLRHPDRRTDTERTLAEVSRAGEPIYYEVTVDVRSGVSEFIEWYRANQEWYEPLIRAS